MKIKTKFWLNKLLNQFMVDYTSLEIFNAFLLFLWGFNFLFDEGINQTSPFLTAFRSIMSPDYWSIIFFIMASLELFELLKGGTYFFRRAILIISAMLWIFSSTFLMIRDNLFFGSEPYLLLGIGCLFAYSFIPPKKNPAVNFY